VTSSSLSLDPRRRTFVRLIGEIRHALNTALAEEHEKRGLTRAEIARLLGQSKSVVNRKLAGTGNMTLETVADLAYALDRPVKVDIPARGDATGLNGMPSTLKTETRARGADDNTFIATAA
jgi:transcriptional regulator with XRE-family HTH domain